MAWVHLSYNVPRLEQHLAAQISVYSTNISATMAYAFADMSDIAYHMCSGAHHSNALGAEATAQTIGDSLNGILGSTIGKLLQTQWGEAAEVAADVHNSALQKVDSAMFPNPNHNLTRTLIGPA